ncbi:beta-ketoacyl synthase N-terminal-like domain-containing protein [Cutibacterium avidum]|uniref:beta-ketoacyl synthase N-terminal-like domain-containing protein n=1 Tax=Cutibacterium avidum TaxID=33010 RepID=UPI00290CCD7C|nr:beta-ketoacyl synthase N-terminal-like domain-containing protein [Cutibacterium avidum]
MNIAVTGRGLLTSLGIGLAASMDSLRSGRCGIELDENAPAGAIACTGRIHGFDPAEYVPPRIRVQTDRWTHLGLAVAAEALHEARLDQPDPIAAERIGVMTAVGSGGNEFGQHELQKLHSRGPANVGPYQSIAWFSAALTGQMSIQFGLKGPCGVVAAQEAGGIEAIAAAAGTIASGEADQIVISSAEAQLNPYALACLQSQQGFSAERDPSTAFQPFTTRAAGLVPAEGASALVLEDEDSARRRGVPVLAFVAGFGSSFSLPSDPRQDAILASIHSALNVAGLSIDDIDLVIPNAVADPALDLAEVAALRTLFGDRQPPVLLAKTAWGGLCSASAVADANVAIHVQECGCDLCVPMAADKCLSGLDIITSARPLLKPRQTLILAAGFDGARAALILQATHNNGR